MYDNVNSENWQTYSEYVKPIGKYAVFNLFNVEVCTIAPQNWMVWVSDDEKNKPVRSMMLQDYEAKEVPETESKQLSIVPHYRPMAMCLPSEKSRMVRSYIV